VVFSIPIPVKKHIPLKNVHSTPLGFIVVAITKSKSPDLDATSAILHCSTLCYP
jgi:hypothetical protein